MTIILAFLAGLFFATAIAGWICAHVSRCRFVAEQAKAHYLSAQWQHVVSVNAALGAQCQRLQEQIREMTEGGEFPGDEWKNPGNN